MRGGPGGKSGNWGRELNRLLILREQQLQTVHEIYGLKASQMSKARASSHKHPDVEEIKNLCEQNFE